MHPPPSPDVCSFMLAGPRARAFVRARASGSTQTRALAAPHVRSHAHANFDTRSLAHVARAMKGWLSRAWGALTESETA
eukprot:6197274-Pleurochrysis_carterae.AAC.2